MKEERTVKVETDLESGPFTFSGALEIEINAFREDGPGPKRWAVSTAKMLPVTVGGFEVDRDTFMAMFGDNEVLAIEEAAVESFFEEMRDET